MKVEAEGACLVQSVNGETEAVIRPLSNEETAKLRAELRAGQGDGR
jgi:hypothetical protein